MRHTPVLLEETLELLDPHPGEFFIDGTLGDGGHAKEIIKRISPGGTFLGVDWDSEAAKKMESEIKNPAFAGASAGRQELRDIIIVNDNYANLPEILRSRRLPKADGLLLDLGLSSTQLEVSGRGFSFMRDEPLDMRYHKELRIRNYELGRNACIKTAREVVNSESENKLAEIFWKYGEEGASRKIARAVVRARAQKPITTTQELCAVIRSVKPRHGRIHPATKVFMALRIFVNSELENLETAIQNIPRVLKMGGRAAVISFHSLEDRAVKTGFRRLFKTGVAKSLTKKVVKPARAEVSANPRSRSAKLRATTLVAV